MTATRWQQTAELALLTAAEIEAAGWGQGQLVDPDTGAICAQAGILCALQHRDDLRPAWVWLEDDIERHVGADPIAWNDADGRTEQEVLDAFQTVAKINLARADQPDQGATDPPDPPCRVHGIRRCTICTPAAPAATSETP